MIFHDFLPWFGTQKGSNSCHLTYGNHRNVLKECFSDGSGMFLEAQTGLLSSCEDDPRNIPEPSEKHSFEQGVEYMRKKGEQGVEYGSGVEQLKIMFLIGIKCYLLMAILLHIYNMHTLGYVVFSANHLSLVIL